MRVTNEYHETRGNPIASDAGASSQLYKFLTLRGVPFEVVNTKVSGSQLRGRSRLKISMSDELIGMVRRRLRVFGGPNSPFEYMCQLAQNHLVMGKPTYD